MLEQIRVFLERSPNPLQSIDLTIASIFVFETELCPDCEGRDREANARRAGLLRAIRAFRP